MAIAGKLRESGGDWERAVSIVEGWSHVYPEFRFVMTRGRIRVEWYAWGGMVANSDDFCEVDW